MGREMPPQKFCDKCEMPDYEYPYVSYTGQIEQVTRVMLGETHYYDGFSSGECKLGIDMGYLCQDCRQKLYEKVIGFLSMEHDKYKDYPKRIDETTEHYVKINGKDTIDPWWKSEIVIKSHTGKTLKDGKFVD